MEHFEWALEKKFGKISQEAISIMMAKGGIRECGLFHKAKNESSIDALILEYEDKCSAMFWEFVKWTIGTMIAIAGLYIAYLSFVK